MARNRGLVIAGLVVVGIAVAIFVTVRSGTDNSDPPAPAGTTVARGPAAELVGLLERSQQVDLDVAYSVDDPVTGPSTARLRRRSPLARLDTESGSGDTITRGVQVVTSSGPLTCTQQGSSPWACAPKPDLRLRDVDVVSPALVATLSALDVSVRDDRIRNEAVRCFTVAHQGDTPTTDAGRFGAGLTSAELCLTPDGIPVRVAAGSTRLEMVSLARGRLPDSAFEPPAPVGR